MLRFRVLGSLDLVEADGTEIRSVLSQPKGTALLAYLAAARPSGFHRRESLLALFWPERDEEHARNALNQSLYKLRRSLGAEVIESRGREEVGIAEGSLWCDAEAFRTAQEAGDRERALELYRGELLEGFHLAEAPEFERWLERERSHLRRRARETAVELAEAAERPDERRRWLERALAIVPTDEEAARRLIEVLHETGDRAGALRLYETLAHRLDVRFEAKPAAETRALIERVRAVESGSPVPVGTASAEQGGRLRVRADSFAAGDAAATDASPAPGTPDRDDRHRRLTWRHPLGAGALAFVLVGFVAAGYTVLDNLGFDPPPALMAGAGLDAPSTLVLADFEGADSVLTAAVTEALRADLEQSPALTLLSPERRREALERMERDPGRALPLEGARALARREGLKGAIGGTVQPAGDGYVLTARLVGADSGEPLISERETAADDGEVIEAIDKLSASVRERAGESLESIRASPPLERVTTSSLEALELYTRAERAHVEGRMGRATALLERAVELDTTFALAYRKLGVMLASLDRSGDAREAYRRAYELRERLSDLERTRVEGVFHYVVRGDPQRAAAEYEAYLKRHPEGGGFNTNNLAHAYLNLRSYEQAEEVALRLIETEPDYPGGYRIAIAARVGQGKLDEAAEVLRRMSEVLPDHPDTRRHAARLAYNRGAYERADSVLLEALRKERSSTWVRSRFYELLASLRAVRGRIVEADSLHDLQVDLRSPPGRVDRIHSALRLGRFRLFAAGDTSGALALVDDALSGLVEGDALGPWDLSYDRLAAFYAFAGRPAAARRHLARRREALDAGEAASHRGRLWRAIARGGLALSVGRAGDAVRHFESALEVPASIGCGGEACVLPLLARARRAAGDPEGELEALERYVSGHSQYRIGWDALFLGPAYERLAALYDQGGEPEKAGRYYARFVELWKNADETLQSRVDAARARLEQILAESS